tara:strand:- start:379 stop:654 length:276 start_codon:yes stop_codon:yes gene_type:complete
LKINNSLDVARWEKLECQCDMHNETKCYPFVKCEHCRCQECWDSVPQEDFTVKENDIDDNGNPLETTHDKIVNEITLVRGHDLEDVIGWTF